MCLIIFSYKMHPKYPLIVAANRDEEYKRKTAPIHFWEDEPDILAGRDLEKLGTWMGVTKSGKFAALTNYRDFSMEFDGKRSRGELVKDALTYKGNLIQYMTNLGKKNEDYPGYNLLAGDNNELYYYSNISKTLQKLEPGIYGLSNALLNTSWPKVEIGKAGMKELLNKPEKELIEGLFNLMESAEPYPDDKLPSTGIPIELERALSPLYIKMDGYGTRSTTIMLMSEESVEYIEKSDQVRRFEFQIK